MFISEADVDKRGGEIQQQTAQLQLSNIQAEEVFTQGENESETDESFTTATGLDAATTSPLSKKTC